MDVNLFVGLNVAKFEFVFQIIATLILLWILYKKVFPNFKKYLNERQNFINDSISSIKSDSEEIQSLKEQKKEEITELRQNQKDIMETYKQEANSKANDIVEEAKTKSRYLLEKNANEIEQEKDIVRKELQGEVIDIATLVSEKFLSNKITKEEDIKFISDALKVVENE